MKTDTTTTPTPATIARQCAEEIDCLAPSPDWLYPAFRKQEMEKLILKAITEATKGLDADTARLDWLISHKAYVAWSRDREVC